jgi:DNA ligase-1
VKKRIIDSDDDEPVKPVSNTKSEQPMKDDDGQFRRPITRNTADSSDSPPSKKPKTTNGTKSSTDSKKPASVKAKDAKPIASIFAKPVKKEVAPEKSESPVKDDFDEEGEDELDDEAEDEQEGEAAVKLYVLASLVARNKPGSPAGFLSCLL